MWRQNRELENRNGIGYWPCNLNKRASPKTDCAGAQGAGSNNKAIASGASRNGRVKKIISLIIELADIRS